MVLLVMPQMHIVLLVMPQMHIVLLIMTTNAYGFTRDATNACKKYAFVASRVK
jgi:hypothetical protein